MLQLPASQQSMQTSQLSSMASEDSSIKSLSTDLLGLLTNGRFFSDVTFEVEGQHVYAHRCVLAARSPFFRMIFCGDAQLHNDTQPRPRTPQIIPVGIVGFEVFKLLLQFLYSGKFSFSSPSIANACREKLCRHTHCTSAVEFGLETLNAAHFFGVDELTTITQKHLGDIAGQASIDNVMRMLVASHKQEETHLWTLCSNLVGKSALSRETLSKHLPVEVVSVIEQIRHKTYSGYGGSVSTGAITDNRTNRMQKALDSSDVELVKLMVMGEGLDLDRALGLHYAVEKCSMKVVKTLLDLGAADVNLRGADGRTPLHIAAEKGDPEKIALLLDHHADPHMQAATGATAMDIVHRRLGDVLNAAGYNTKSDQSRLRMCLDLLDRAIAAPPPMHIKHCTKVESPASILTDHGSSMLMQEDGDNFPSMSRVMGSSPHGVFSNTDYTFLSQGTPPGKVPGREIERRGAVGSISRLLRSSPLAFGFPVQQLQAESRTLTSNYSMLETSSFEDRRRKVPRLVADLKDLPVLKEIALNDITNETTDSLKSVVTPNSTEDEVNSGLQQNVLE